MYIIRWHIREGKMHEAIVSPDEEQLFWALEAYAACDWYKVCGSDGPIVPRSREFKKWVRHFPWEESKND